VHIKISCIFVETLKNIVMKELEMLEMELSLLLDNIKRLKEYKDENENNKWTPCNSRVVGEFKHRLTALKQRMTLVSQINTSQLFK
jgi:hypothetical protein